MEHITFLNLLAHTNVCSHAIVLKCSGTLSSALYISLHFGSTWLRRCSLSITFEINFQASLNGLGKGRSCFEIFRLSMWHMLSYAKQMDDIACRISSSECVFFMSLNFLCNHRIVTRKACVGDSDLLKKRYPMRTCICKANCDRGKAV